MDRIIDVLGEIKKRESFLFKRIEPYARSAHPF